MSKKKAANKKNAKATEEDDDWDSILAAHTPAPAPAAAAEPAAAAVPPPAAGEDEDDEESDDEAAGAAGGGAKKDKKKKKKKTKKEREESAAATAAAKKSSNKPLSAAAQAALLHQQRIAEEEARLARLREEEERRIREEEERLAEEQRKIEEEKERKRKAKADKIEAQKAAGTYMTKAEKERAKKAAARLESLKASGMLSHVPLDATNNASNGAPTEPVKASALFRNVKKKKPNAQAQSAAQAQAASTEAQSAPTQAEKAEDEVPDDWDADSDKEEEEAVKEPSPAVTATEAAAEESESSGDDWDADSDADDDAVALKLQQKMSQLSHAAQDEVEDELELEKKRKEKEDLERGRERLRREEETRKQREEEERLREEMERHVAEALMRKEASRRARTEREAAARAARSPAHLRAPISCIMGHVDTGKTKLLDKIRHTNVQEGEAGGITQQIGATQFSRETLQTQTACMQSIAPFDINIPGMLIIDTPGHESFSNLRSRGSSLCDMAILVIDLMHGLEPQTIESLNMLKRRKAPFIVALNKVDRCYSWKTMPDSPIQTALAAQNENVMYEFRDRTRHVITQLMEQGLNSALYWENDDPAHTVSLVPTSAISGEGVPDLIRLLITLTQSRLTEQLMYCEALQCTVLEVKAIEGLGHTVDVVLVNGTLRQGDTIVVSTMDGPVVTTIRALLTPPPNREMRVKGEYVHHSEIKGAIGVKLVGNDMSRVVAGTPLLVVDPADDIEDVKEEVQSDLSKLLKSLQTDNRGVMVHASTLGALEALLQFLREETKPPIPVAHIHIGPVHKKDVIVASIMHEKKLPEFATILAFDVPIDSDARDMAEELNVRIFTAEIIYHLFDQFTAMMNALREERKKAASEVVVFPAVLKILPQYIFNKKDPIVIGVEVMEGTLRLNTPLCVPHPLVDIGRVTRMELNHKEVTVAKKGTQVSVRIVNESNPTLTYGRQFDDKNTLYSKISRQSIDACKEFFKDDLTKDDWALTVKLKKVFNIM